MGAERMPHNHREFRAGSVLLLVMGVFATLDAGCTGTRSRVGAIAPDGSSEFTLMDFATPAVGFHRVRRVLLQTRT